MPFHWNQVITTTGPPSDLFFVHMERKLFQGSCWTETIDLGVILSARTCAAHITISWWIVNNGMRFTVYGIQYVRVYIPGYVIRVDSVEINT